MGNIRRSPGDGWNVGEIVGGRTGIHCAGEYWFCRDFIYNLHDRAGERGAMGHRDFCSGDDEYMAYRQYSWRFLLYLSRRPVQHSIGGDEREYIRNDRLRDVARDRNPVV